MKYLIVLISIFSIRAYGFIDGKTEVICDYNITYETEELIHYEMIEVKGILIDDGENYPIDQYKYYTVDFSIGLKELGLDFGLNQYLRLDVDPFYCRRIL